MAEKIQTVQEYFSAVEPGFRAELERIRELVMDLVPGLEETLSYSMPTLKYKGRALVYFTASKKHLSFYPSSWAIEELAERLTDYKTTVHAIQFTPAHPLPAELIKDLVLAHMREIDAGRH
ncbi:iron chaperone [Glutamicibacter sp. NPDC087344]|uniref:iron chaperone n=1 Tax=Glutamicibacter sp. NPDC087344 TaxID=3363994 RepID=UPI0038008906